MPFPSPPSNLTLLESRINRQVDVESGQDLEASRIPKTLAKDTSAPTFFFGTSQLFRHFVLRNAETKEVHFGYKTETRRMQPICCVYCILLSLYLTFVLDTE